MDQLIPVVGTMALLGSALVGGILFAFVGRAGGEASSELIVVENFFEELKAKVGN